MTMLSRPSTTGQGNAALSRRKFFTKTFLLLLCQLALMLSLPQRAIAADPADHQVKAAMTYNMLRFIDWPDESNRTMTLCVTGDSLFAKSVFALKGRVAKGRTLDIRQVEPPGIPASCDALLFGNLSSAAISSALKQTANAAVVTISDSNDFVSSGGIIGFVIKNDKVRFEINQKAARQKGIRISAQLLKLAIEVVD